MRKMFCALFAAASFWAVPSAHGYIMFHSVAEGLHITSGNAILADIAMETLLDNKGDGKAKSKPAKSNAVSTAIAKPSGNAGIEMLVAGYQDGQKAEARKVFAQMIDMSEPVTQQLDVPAHDMGSAAAALIAGSYAACKNKILPNEYFKPLTSQMQRAFAHDAKFSRMSDTEKQRMYQILVGIGMFLTMAQMENMKNPDAQITAQLQSAGGEFLRQFTHLDPASIRLDENGLNQAR